MMREAHLSDAELAALHGDSQQHPISRWREQVRSGATDLDYVDWRCDRLWRSAQRRRSA